MTTVIVLNGLSVLLALFSAELKLRLKQGRTDAGQASLSEASDNVAALGSGKMTDLVEPRSVTKSTTELLEAVARVTKPRDS